MRIDRNSPEVLAQILSPEYQERFWKFVERKGPDECWPWKGGMIKGYGQKKVTTNGTSFCFRANRLAWIIHNLQFPPSDKPMILHSCIGCPECVNPTHLRPGTGKENMADKVNQGRANWAVGGRAYGCKLSEADVIEIRSLIARGHMLKDIAPMFGVGKGQISKINLNQRWKHVVIT